MAISYNKLWKLLIDKKMTKTELRLAADISTTTLAKLGKDETVSMDVMLRICKVLNCGIENVLEIVNEQQITK
ncbi:MAG: helix-turn-helix transcriptional regulator [Clostridia bacterium]|nr:helix-turn-helix transcriptional regulator [Clostridia bacterium]